MGVKKGGPFEKKVAALLILKALVRSASGRPAGTGFNAGAARDIRYPRRSRRGSGCFATAPVRDCALASEEAAELITLAEIHY